MVLGVIVSEDCWADPEIKTEEARINTGTEKGRKLPAKSRWYGWLYRKNYLRGEGVRQRSGAEAAAKGLGYIRGYTWSAV